MYKAMTKQGFNHGDSYDNDHKWDQGKASSGIRYTFKLNPRLNGSKYITGNGTIEAYFQLR